MVFGKAERRVEVLRARSSLSPADLVAAERAVTRAVLEERRRVPAGRLAAYASGGTEPGTRALLDAVPDVLLPVLLPDGDLDWAVYDGELVPGRRGLLEPPGPRLGRDAIAGCGLVVVPALAVDRRGVRLGRGGGSYDRALARTAGRVVALLHDGELVEQLPAEPHDRPVHAVVMPDEGLVELPLRLPDEM
jgi:5-formyltetrahydrofolate cyclo-ligase